MTVTKFYDVFAALEALSTCQLLEGVILLVLCHIAQINLKNS